MDQAIHIRAQKQSELCRLLGNPSRLLILWSLADGELPVNEIAARVGGSLQNVSQHLSLLKTHRIIASRRDGRHIYYHINHSETLNNCMAMSANSGQGLERMEEPIHFGG